MGCSDRDDDYTERHKRIKVKKDSDKEEFEKKLNESDVVRELRFRIEILEEEIKKLKKDS
jgi:hypothetical protein